VVEALVVAVLVGALVTRFVLRRRRRRNAERRVYIPTYPTIELEQPYGGWDADPSDAYTEHGEPRVPFITCVGPPSRWGRLP
jgi:hypothetical protein